MAENPEVIIIEDSSPDSSPPPYESVSSDARSGEAFPQGGLLTLELSPIERREPRCYNRIAMVIPWNRIDSILGMQMEDVMRCVKNALLVTLHQWPFLAGHFEPPSEDRADLQLVYPKLLDGLQLDQLVERQMPNDLNWAPSPGHTYRMSLETFERKRFVWQQDPQDNDEFPPITLKVSLADDRLVLGFAFSRNIFDGEAIENFFARFLANTNPAKRRRPEADCRAILDSLPDQPDLNLFPCYNWNSGDLEPTTPRERLRAHVVTFSPQAMVMLQRAQSEFQYQNRELGVALYEDCIFAYFWVLILRARCRSGKLGLRDACRVNYLVPGGYHTRLPRRIDPEYCGNATGTVIAKCDVSDLVEEPDADLDLLPQSAVIKGVSLGARLLRYALQTFDRRHLQHLSTIKDTVDPERERLAYQRALKRHTQGLVFEDWTSYGSSISNHIPYAKELHPYYFPCFDTLEEGSVILLPRKGGYAQMGAWYVCICLDEEDMDKLLDDLDQEKWIDPDRDLGSDLTMDLGVDFAGDLPVE